ncbi:GNAT family N-acetyltransferase [Neobacillus sp. 179-C4.2 HS]|uniref:GNAT family N-acetyltransferase n=1 Tax=Neobacillus driksii TaxID=3035913 RepID=A0ABV4YRQ3_9BACI|nr:GNAT family N-acetyltransferase [Neobacillus sp. 179.-C4.2 HS]MDP5194994.1 GNAT family N-acetyltransferase [Neobacillus sp. 179.-C4.2 HS]
MKVSFLKTSDYEEMKMLFLDVFSNEPWFDKWNREQLDLYMKDLTENHNSLSFALFDEKEELIGCSLGYIFNWWEGREYFIKEFFISREIQSQGAGSTFLTLLNDRLRVENVQHITLATEKNVPAYHFYQKNGFSVLENSAFLVKKVSE